MMQRGLVLQGGGALGAYELGALSYLYREAHFRPDIISGVSIGAITAAVLVGSRDDDPVLTLERIWERFETVPLLPMPDFAERFIALYGNRSFFRMRTDYLTMPFWTNFYDTRPLKETLDEFISFDRINAGGQHLLLTATNVETGRIEVFDNRSGGTPITADHVLASGSLPPGFPMTEIRGSFYWDGGLFDNTPLGPVIEAFDSDPGTEKQLVVINLFPSAGRIPANMQDVFDRMFEMIFSNKLHGDVEMMRKVNEYVEVADAVERALAADSPIRNMPGYRRLMKYKLINSIIHITNEDPELVSGPFDFSRESIKRRKEAGYRDARAAFPK